MFMYYKCQLVGFIIDWLGGGMKYDLKIKMKRICELFEGSMESALDRCAKINAWLLFYWLKVNICACLRVWNADEFNKMSDFRTNLLPCLNSWHGIFCVCLNFNKAVIEYIMDKGNTVHLSDRSFECRVQSANHIWRSMKYEVRESGC